MVSAPVRLMVWLATAWALIASSVVPASAQDAGPRAERTSGESTLAQAAAAYEAGELDVALARYEQALRAGGLEGDALASVAMRLVVLRAASGDAAGARTAMRTALVVRPELDAPPELDDATRTALERERAALGPGISLALGDRLVVRDGRISVGVTLLRAAGVADELAATLDTESDGALTALGPPDASMLSWPTTLEGASEATLRVEARDTHGNVLVRSEITLPIERVPSLELERPLPRQAEDDGALWIGLGVGGGVIVIATVIVVAVVLSTPSDRIGTPIVERTP